MPPTKWWLNKSTLTTSEPMCTEIMKHMRNIEVLQWASVRFELAQHILVLSLTSNLIWFLMAIATSKIKLRNLSIALSENNAYLKLDMIDSDTQQAQWDNAMKLSTIFCRTRMNHINIFSLLMTTQRSACAHPLMSHCCLMTFAFQCQLYWYNIVWTWPIQQLHLHLYTRKGNHNRDLTINVFSSNTDALHPARCISPFGVAPACVSNTSTFVLAALTAATHSFTSSSRGLYSEYFKITHRGSF